MNEDTVAGKLKNVGGKLEQATGEALGNQKLANEGAADRVKGAAQETWGKTKDVASDATSEAQVDGKVASVKADESAHNTRDSIAGAVEHAKDSISRGIEHLKEKIHGHEDHEISQVH